jgi:hypothetical protein
MSSIDPNDMTRSSSSKEDGLAQLSKDIIHQNKNQSISFFVGRSAENAKRIKNVQDKFVNSQVRSYCLLDPRLIIAYF